MKLGVLTDVFKDEIKQAISISKVSRVITENNVFQEEDRNMLPVIEGMVSSLMLPGSGVDGLENLEELLAKAESGKSCLLLMEHFTNFDLTALSLLVQRAGGRGKDIAQAIIAIAGMKLNEDSPIVAAYASAYTRIVIYPSRSLHGMEPEQKQAELARSLAINRNAMKKLEEIKTQGKLILVFPAGTRYRPWDPSTKRGVREIDSYIRSFDYMCCVALNGETLRVNQIDMINDTVHTDIVRITAGPVQSCAEFRAKAKTAAEAAGVEDKKQAVVDAIMAELEQLHITTEEKRKKMEGYHE